MIKFLRLLSILLGSIALSLAVSSLALGQAGGEFFGRWKSVGQHHDVRLEILFDQNKRSDAGRGFIYLTARNSFRVNCPTSLGRLCLQLKPSQDVPILSEGVQFADGQALAAVKLPGESETFLIEISRQPENRYRMRLYHPNHGVLIDTWTERTSHPCDRDICRPARFRNLAQTPEKFYGPLARRSFRRTFSQYLDFETALPGHVYVAPSGLIRQFDDPGSRARAAYCGVTKGLIFSAKGDVPHADWDGNWAIWDKSSVQIGLFRPNRRVENYTIVASAAFGGARFNDSYIARFTAQDAGPWGATFTIRAKADSTDARVSGQLVVCAFDDEQQARGKIRLNGRQSEVYIRPIGTGAPVGKNADRMPKRVVQKMAAVEQAALGFEIGSVTFLFGKNDGAIEITGRPDDFDEEAPYVDEASLELSPIAEEILWEPQYGGDQLTIWEHEGSKMAYESVGNRRWIWFWSPREELRDAVERGTLLFEGRKQGSRLVGSAREFSVECGAFNFSAEGAFANNVQAFSLIGRQLVRSDDCSVIRAKQVNLGFKLLGDGAAFGLGVPEEPVQEETVEIAESVPTGGFSDEGLQQSFFAVANLNGGSLNVRSGPGTKYGVVSKLAHDATGLRVARCVPDVENSKWQGLSDAQRSKLISRAWCEISFGQLTGFVYGKYLGPAS